MKRECPVNIPVVSGPPPTERGGKDGTCDSRCESLIAQDQDLNPTGHEREAKASCGGFCSEWSAADRKDMCFVFVCIL